jgi:hypothetical protein
MWAAVVAGLVPNGDAVVWIAHASGCDPCAALLRDAVQTAALDPATLALTSEDIAHIERIDTPAWRSRMARILGEASSEASGRATARQSGWRNWLRRPAR